MSGTKRNLHVVEGKPALRCCRSCGTSLDLACGLCLGSEVCCTCKLVPRFVTNAERSRLPLVNQHGEQVVASLPERGHEALSRLIGKK